MPRPADDAWAAYEAASAARHDALTYWRGAIAAAEAARAQSDAAWDAYQAASRAAEDAFDAAIAAGSAVVLTDRGPVRFVLPEGVMADAPR